jgi:hypothetical protein
MNFTDLYPSRYLTKGNFEKPALLTISRIEVENVAPDNMAPERKPVLFFAELEQGMVLNKTNGNTVASLYGANTDGWIGQRIVVYNDPSVRDPGGRIVGGIRLRAPKPQAVAPAPAPAAGSGFDDLDDDIPF